MHPWVKVIPSGTFSKCDRLQEVQFGFAKSKGDSSITTRHDSSSRQEDDCALIIIGESAFSNCVSLKHVTLPPSLKWIRKSAFEGVSNSDISRDVSWSDQN